MPLEKSMYSLPSTSVSTQPKPFSNATGKSFTWPLKPLKYFVQRACSACDFGPGGGMWMLGICSRSTCDQFCSNVSVGIKILVVSVSDVFAHFDVFRGTFGDPDIGPQVL